MVNQQLNIVNKTDGLYRSYWISKVSNAFIKKGKKKKIIKQFNKGLLLIKYTQNINPLVYVFEIVDKIKPTFKLENAFPGRTAVVYPKVVNVSTQYSVAIRWILAYLLENKRNAGRNTLGFYKHFVAGLTQLTVLKSNPLLKKRDRYHQNAVKLQENVRYTWTKL